MLKLESYVEIIGGHYDGMRGWIFDLDDNMVRVELLNGDIEWFDEEAVEVLGWA